MLALKNKSRWENISVMVWRQEEEFHTQNTSHQSPSGNSGEWLTGLNPIPDDGHVVIPIRPRLLVPEAQRVKELVLNGPNPVTVLSDRELLQAHLAVSHWGPATNVEIKLKIDLWSMHHPCATRTPDSVCSTGTFWVLKLHFLQWALFHWSFPYWIPSSHT